MPRYDFACDQCKIIKEYTASRKFYDELKPVCPQCGSSMSRVYDVPQIRFKGKGFYCTDYPKQVDKKGKKSLANEFGDWVKEAESQIEEDEAEDTKGYLYTDKSGKKQFVPDDGIEDVVNDKGKTRVKVRKDYKRV